MDVEFFLVLENGWESSDHREIKATSLLAGGKICLSDHFKPLWARNVPKFGIAHAMALGLGPWLAVEVPDLLSKGLIKHKEGGDTAAGSS